MKSAFLLGYVGEKFDRRDLFVLGREKSMLVYEMYVRDGMPGEFNSPTYYGSNLAGAACWSRYLSDDRFAKRGKRLEDGLCRELAEYYHADLKTVCGPHFRAYGMNMSGMVTPTGLWLSIALNDSRLGPSQGFHTNAVLSETFGFLWRL